MSVRPVLVYGEPRLRMRAAPVDAIDDRLRRLAADMVETMYAAHGRGLAAPQVGVGLRVFVMDCHWKDGAARDPLVLIDPEIVAVSDATATRDEACLSIPGVSLAITRPAEVSLRWRTLAGGTEMRRFAGVEAACAQHELDHLDGILIPDRAPATAQAEVAEALARLAGTPA